MSSSCDAMLMMGTWVVCRHLHVKRHQLGSHPHGLRLLSRSHLLATVSVYAQVVMGNFV